MSEREELAAGLRVWCGVECYEVPDDVMDWLPRVADWMLERERVRTRYFMSALRSMRPLIEAAREVDRCRGRELRAALDALRAALRKVLGEP